MVRNSLMTWSSNIDTADATWSWWFLRTANMFGNFLITMTMIFSFIAFSFIKLIISFWFSNRVIAFSVVIQIVVISFDGVINGPLCLYSNKSSDSPSFSLNSARHPLRQVSQLIKRDVILKTNPLMYPKHWFLNKPHVVDISNISLSTSSSSTSVSGLTDTSCFKAKNTLNEIYILWSFAVFTFRIQLFLNYGTVPRINFHFRLH